MENNNFFNIPQLEKPTNENLTITFNPRYDVYYYKYRIIKDNIASDYTVINNNQPFSFFLDETGTYQLEVIVYDNYNTPTSLTSGKYVIDKEQPVIEVNQISLEMPLGNQFDVMGAIRAYDNVDGDLLARVTTNYDEINFTTLGSKELIYTVSDSAGNISTKTVYINVVPNYAINIFLIQIIMVIFVLFFIGLILRLKRSTELEKRLTYYSINPLVDDSISLFDSILNFYKKVIIKLNKYISKSAFIIRISKRYDKYVKVTNNVYSSGMDFISEKIVLVFFFLLFAVFSKSIRSEMLTIYEALIPIILGLTITDIINVYKYRFYRNKLENDLLQAITIMNNAFKSGRSILQAIHIVTEELDGPVANEFKKMYVEISFGLSIDTVFKRFSDRINLDEATYLTVALSILNKTGGNIIKVFSSIEKTLFNKKKLKLELKALTGSSRIIIGLLIILPVFFVSTIYLLNPNYFEPLYTTEIGVLLFVLMIIIYISYIFVIRKVIRVRM